MKFARCVWTPRNIRGWSPQRLAAAKRAVANEAARVEAAREKVGLFPELAAEIQPRFSSVDERTEEQDRREWWYTENIRASEARKWREGRYAFYSLSPLRRRGLLKLWNQSGGPKGATNFLVFLDQYSNPGANPWTYLRKMRLCWLWNHGGWSKPAHFREITHNFTCLGIVPHVRVRTQSMIHLAKLRGVSLREIAKNRRSATLHHQIYL